MSNRQDSEGQGGIRIYVGKQRPSGLVDSDGYVYDASTFPEADFQVDGLDRESAHTLAKKMAESGQGGGE